jgi:hypothetical protein
MPYECGKDPVGSARDKYSIKFYTVAVIFLLFDIEVLFIIPFAVAFKSLIDGEKLSGIAYGTIAFVGNNDLYRDSGGRLYIRLEKGHFRLGAAGPGRGEGGNQRNCQETA